MHFHVSLQMSHLRAQCPVPYYVVLQQTIAQLFGRHEDLFNPENSYHPSGNMNFLGWTNLHWEINVKYYTTSDKQPIDFLVVCSPNLSLVSISIFHNAINTVPLIRTDEKYVGIGTVVSSKKVISALRNIYQLVHYMINKP